MGRAAAITFATSAVVVAGLVALVVPAFTGMDAEGPKAPVVAAVGPAADAPSVRTTAPAIPENPELPDWAEGSGPWIIYPDGFECQGTEGCPNDYRSLIGEPGDVLPLNVYYYDPAKHDFDPANPNRFFVSPKAAPGADLGPVPGADGYAVVSGVDRQVKSYYVGRADTLDAIGERFSIDPAELTRDGDRLVFP
ncbi:glutamine phosphoribosylpyrophosphate amidotransferase [Microbacterium testaceum StLB037]|uniref:Glutamine phosphoribosylpyrophosphate amidotransferase n=1 Tax=Microbacterium testaceum (strain StLB037) TaxID=979556 RepID=E8N9T9_MICTS|nr:hypothetical protein [Microbacterium testaceum]BAJ74558.1 glutamine phosphoribosylpyrophosphate amidotransferase [Microbacterium testaceum StLB037]